MARMRGVSRRTQPTLSRLSSGSLSSRGASICASTGACRTWTPTSKRGSVRFIRGL
jgi:hypothetical protein